MKSIVRVCVTILCNMEKTHLTHRCVEWMWRVLSKFFLTNLCNVEHMLIIGVIRILCNVEFCVMWKVFCGKCSNN